MPTVDNPVIPKNIAETYNEIHLQGIAIAPIGNVANLTEAHGWFHLRGLDVEAPSGQGCRRLREKAGGNFMIFELYKTYSGVGTNVFRTIGCYPAISFTLQHSEGTYKGKNR